MSVWLWASMACMIFGAWLSMVENADTAGRWWINVGSLLIIVDYIVGVARV